MNHDNPLMCTLCLEFWEIIPKVRALPLWRIRKIMSFARVTNRSPIRFFIQSLTETLPPVILSTSNQWKHHMCIQIHVNLLRRQLHQKINKKIKKRGGDPPHPTEGGTPPCTPLLHHHRGDGGGWLHPYPPMEGWSSSPTEGHEVDNSTPSAPANGG